MLVDVRRLERRGRNRFLALFVVFLIIAAPLFYLLSQATTWRLYTVTSAPSYVPLDVASYWLATGTLIGLLVAIGLWCFAQLARYGSAKQTRRDLERARAWPLAPPPPPGPAMTYPPTTR